MITAEISLPHTSAGAQSAIFDLNAKRATFSEAIEAAIARRRANSALAGLGNAAAKAEVDRAEHDEKQARTELNRLDEAIAALEAHRDVLAGAEREQDRLAREAETVALADEALGISDEIDITLDVLADLLDQRAAALARGGFPNDREAMWAVLAALARHVQPILPVNCGGRHRRFIGDIDGLRLRRKSALSAARGAPVLSQSGKMLAKALLGRTTLDPEAAPFAGMVKTGRSKDGPRFAFQRVQTTEPELDRPLWKLKSGVSSAYLDGELRQVGEKWNADAAPDLELAEPANDLAKKMIGIA